ncbi:S26 family signal peptidase [Kitasatospora sp. NPDC002227]|uniref:S26 family signal peptidase n=1 Tax=Kitasatospora sp. NPDC002227 TaxID=3154773 RepID=UPI003328C476
MTAALLVALAAAVLVARWMVRHRFAVMNVDGISMEPALQHGDRLLVRRCKPARVRAGRIVVVERPDRRTGWSGARHGDGRVRAGSRDWYVKRAVAVGGQRVPTALAELCRLPADAQVPGDSLLLLGDNPRSEDSKQWGYCPGDRLLGVVVRRLGRRG